MCCSGVAPTGVDSHMRTRESCHSSSRSKMSVIRTLSL